MSPVILKNAGPLDVSGHLHLTFGGLCFFFHPEVFIFLGSVYLVELGDFEALTACLCFRCPQSSSRSILTMSAGVQRSCKGVSAGDVLCGETECSCLAEH